MQTPDRRDQQQAALAELSDPVKQNYFDRRGWWGWFFGASILIAVVIALVGLTLVFSKKTSDLLSFGQGNLMVMLVLTNLLFIVYAAYQRRQHIAVRRRRHHRKLLALLTVSRTLGSETNPQSVLDAITGICRRTYDCDQVSLMKLDLETGELVVSSASGHLNVEEVIGSRQRMGQGIAGWVAEKREPIILGPHVNKNRLKNVDSAIHELNGAMVVPIILRDELFGVLSVSSRAKNLRYDEEDLEALLVFAEIAGISSRHSEQTTWMRQTIQKLDSELLEKDRGNGRKAA